MTAVALMCLACGGPAEHGVGCVSCLDAGLAGYRLSDDQLDRIAGLIGSDPVLFSSAPSSARVAVDGKSSAARSAGTAITPRVAENTNLQGDDVVLAAGTSRRAS